ncbi:MAG: ABC transporter ATP-binding protein [Phycisphaeraceae bacterium]|nr:ABC transporter ATP-binding protein [Phycisphaeraceae bacterium]
MIDVQNLVKWYGPTLAVDDISFAIPEGQIVGFLGPNGAGKSTTLRMLTGYIPPTRGQATIAGFNVLTQSESARRQIGYLPESTPLYAEMRVEEYLHFRGKLMDMDRATRKRRMEVVTERCGLGSIRRRIIGQLSRGNRQRVGLAQAMLHDPKVLILDEPTAGLDPNQIAAFRHLIGELRGKHTILLSTHILPEVEKTADRVVIIAGGRIRADGPPEELRRMVASESRIIVEVKASAESVHRVFAQMPQIQEVSTEIADGWCRAIVTPKVGQKSVPEVLGQIALTNQWPVREMRHEVASLEQFFVQITAQQHQAAATDIAAA